MNDKLILTRVNEDGISLKIMEVEIDDGVAIVYNRCEYIDNGGIHNVELNVRNLSECLY